MITKKSVWITVLSITLSAILAIWLYISFHVLIVFLFIPLAFIGPLFGNRGKRKNDNWRDDSQRNPYKNDKIRYLHSEDKVTFPRQSDREMEDNNGKGQTR